VIEALAFEPELAQIEEMRRIFFDGVPKADPGDGVIETAQFHRKAANDLHRDRRVFLNQQTELVAGDFNQITIGNANYGLNTTVIGHGALDAEKVAGAESDGALFAGHRHGLLGPDLTLDDNIELIGFSFSLDDDVRVRLILYHLKSHKFLKPSRRRPGSSRAIVNIGHGRGHVDALTEN
jgi:hypothetical protein